MNVPPYLSFDYETMHRDNTEHKETDLVTNSQLSFKADQKANHFESLFTFKIHIFT